MFKIAVSCLWLLFPGYAEFSYLPENLETPYSGCYGTHDFQPGCRNIDTIMAVRGTLVGAKPLMTGCPQTAEVVNGVLVDAMDKSTPVNKSQCCTPNYRLDCISRKTKEDYIYQRRCTGLAICSRPSAIFWDMTDLNSCPTPYRGPHLTETNYMFMEYYCIPRTRISTMSNYVAKSVTSPYYLQSPGYPFNFTSGSSTCSLTADSCKTSFYIYTIDIRLVSNGNVCRQGLSVLIRNQTILSWDCETQTYFNITNQTIGYNHVTVKFTNEMSLNGGSIWIGFQTSDDSPVHLHCPALQHLGTDCILSTMSPSKQSGERSNATLTIAGSVVGLTTLVGVINACLLWFCVVRKRKKSKPIDENQNKIKSPNVDDGSDNNPGTTILSISKGIERRSLPPVGHSFSNTSKLPITQEYNLPVLPPITRHQNEDKSSKENDSKKLMKM